MEHKTFTNENGIIMRDPGYPDSGNRYLGLTDDEGEIRNRYINIDSVIGAELADLFVRKRDEKLGRWRGKVDPDVVIYPNGYTDSILVLNEKTQESWRVHAESRASDDIAPIVHEYREDTAPWKNAKEGEVWLVKIRGSQWYAEAVPALFDGSKFHFLNKTGTDADIDYCFPSSIERAKRIWPEEAN